MPKINVYLPDDLAAAVREAGIPVSAVCQRALADAVSAADGRPGEQAGPKDESTTTTFNLRDRLTDKARRVLDLAADGSGGELTAVTSIELAAALIEQGNNLALAVLRSLDIEAEDLLSELRATTTAARRAGTEQQAASGYDQLRDRAAEAAGSLGSNFIGCEHLLLAILAGPDTDPANATLRTLGLDLETGRNAVRAALSGFSYAQGALSLSALSAPVRSVLEEIRQRLGRLEQPGN